MATPESGVQALGAVEAADVQALGNTLPIGNFETLYSRGFWGNGPYLIGQGWAIDPDTADPVTLHVYINGAWAWATVAGDERPDVAAAYPGYGPNHGFMFSDEAERGLYEVCVYAIDNQVDAHTALGCRTNLVGQLPRGNFESVTATRSGATVTGWAYDSDDADPAATVDIHVYVDGAWGGALKTGVSRPDIPRRFPNANPRSGFAGTIATGPGSHQVCAYAIDTTVASLNTPLGCRSVTVGGNSLPVGNFEAVRALDGSVTLTGWAFDPDNPSAPVDVHFFLQMQNGPRGGGSVTTGVARPDVAAAFPGAGPHQGFSLTFTTALGFYEVCAFAIDNQVDSNTYLGCHPFNAVNWNNW